MPTFRMNRSQLARFAWALLAFNLFVILWGVLVRATGSGAGCGNHWPTCNGDVLPTLAQMETFIEFFHRLTTGVDLPLMLIALFFGYKLYPAKHPVRGAAFASTIFLLIEALIGAVLVRFELVVDNDTAIRALVVALHLVNTFFLLGALSLFAWWASGNEFVSFDHKPRLLRWLLGSACIGIVLLAANGAVTALGDTLYLQAGISPESSPLVARLLATRIYHPLFAILMGGLLWWAVQVALRGEPTPRLKRTGYALLGIYAVQFLAGALNVLLHAPVWLQILHLFLADLIWIGLILLSAQRLALPVEMAEPAPQPSVMAHSAD